MVPRRLAPNIPFQALLYYAWGMENLLLSFEAAVLHLLRADELGRLTALTAGLVDTHGQWKEARFLRRSTFGKQISALKKALGHYDELRDRCQLLIEHVEGGDVLQPALSRCPPRSELRAATAPAAIERLLEATAAHEALLAEVNGSASQREALQAANQELLAVISALVSLERLQGETSERYRKASAALVKHLRLLQRCLKRSSEGIRESVMSLRSHCLPVHRRKRALARRKK